MSVDIQPLYPGASELSAKLNRAAGFVTLLMSLPLKHPAEVPSEQPDKPDQKTQEGDPALNSLDPAVFPVVKVVQCKPFKETQEALPRTSQGTVKEISPRVTQSK